METYTRQGFHRGQLLQRSPHSLGKSVEWKPSEVVKAFVGSGDDRVPTRWGNQLNGNWIEAPQSFYLRPGPHSLGKSVEWKHDCPNLGGFLVQPVPTRWGNQLNGNSDSAKQTPGDRLVPTRWGNQLNGNLHLILL